MDRKEIKNRIINLADEFIQNKIELQMLESKKNNLISRNKILFTDIHEYIDDLGVGTPTAVIEDESILVVTDKDITREKNVI